MDAVFAQSGHPRGMFGRLVLASMNMVNGRFITWAANSVDSSALEIIDVGCGSGKAVRRFAKQFSRAHVTGIDLSGISVSAATERNRDLISCGRVKIAHGDVCKLPFADQSIDHVSSISSHYYWDDFGTAIGELHRVLVPGGKLVFVAERAKIPEKMPTFPSVTDNEVALRAAGFVNVQSMYRSNAVVISATREDA